MLENEIVLFWDGKFTSLFLSDYPLDQPLGFNFSDEILFLCMF